MESPGVVVVPLQPLPLPTATIKAQVFADVTEANGQYDPGEDGLSGFAGKITDYLGQVNTDVFGNPLCTTYAYTDANGNGIQDPGEIDLSGPDYEPTLVHLGGKCLSGDINMDGVVNGADTSLYNSLGLDPALARGVLTIPNLGPEPLRAVARPADGLELGPDDDPRGQPRLGRLGRWRAPPVYDTEFVVAGEPFPATDLRLRPRPDDVVLDTERPPVPGRRAPARSRASSTRWTSTSRRRAGSTCRRSASRARRSTTRSTSRGSRCPT